MRTYYGIDMEIGSPEKERAERVVFANQLRGVAALSVVLSHFLIVFPDQQTVSRMVGTKPLIIPTPPWGDWLPSLYFDLGLTAVAVFFLISGFAIPFSLERSNTWRFLLARAIRIYPLYWVCLAIGLLALKLADTGSQLTVKRALTNALLIHGYCGEPSLDWVNWTLAIEVKFYVVVALLGTGLVKKRFSTIFAFSLTVLSFLARFSVTSDGLLYKPILFRVLLGFAADTHYLIYMLIGTLYYQHHRKGLNDRKLAIQSSTLLVLFGLAWCNSPVKAQFPWVTLNYLYAFLIFATAYQLRKYWRAVRLLEWLAAISYPLYAVHTLVGFVFLKAAIRTGWSYYQALPVALAGVFVLSYFLHHLVEKPSQKAGREWATELEAS